MRIGTNVWLGYEPLYLAQSLNYLNPDQVRLVEYASSTQTMRGIVDGAIEAAALTLDEALFLQQQGIEVRIILVIDYSFGADALLSQTSIKNLAALKNKRIGAETSALGAYMMQRVLDKAKLRIEDVNVVSLGSAQHEDAFINKQVDAIVTFDPIRSRLISRGANVLLDTSDLPGEIVDVLVIREDHLSKHQHNVEFLLQQWFRSLNYLQQHPGDAAKHMTPRMKISAEEMQQAFQGIRFPNRSENHKLLSGSPSPLEVQSDYLGEVMLKGGILPGPVTASDLFDSARLEDLYP
jgi:NitT/TauT family transport system substrate-binding protein